MGKRRIIVVLMILLIFISPLSETIIGPDVSSPTNVNQIISDFSNIDMRPGHEKNLDFDLYNPYNSSMRDIKLEIEIYEFRSFNENENLDDIDNSIYFEKSQANKVVFKKDGLTSGKIIPNSYLVTSDEKTRKGVYSIRFKLSFNMDGKNITMKSIGYFSNDELNDASHSDNNEHIVGGYNITKLGVDGILRETSISVKESKSTWPQYVLGAITVILSILAVYFYLKENKN